MEVDIRRQAGQRLTGKTASPCFHRQITVYVLMPRASTQWPEASWERQWHSAITRCPQGLRILYKAPGVNSKGIYRSLQAFV